MPKQFYILIITIFFSLIGKAQTYDEQYKICSEPLGNLIEVDSLYFDKIMQRDSCLIGAPAPDFKVITLDHKEIELSKLKGQVVVLNFWFTRCQPCIIEMPGFNKLVELYGDKNVKFISFTYDSSEVVQKFLKQHPFEFTHVVANDEVRSNNFKLFSAWPYTIIIDKEGKITFMKMGSKEEKTFEYFNKIIEKLL